MLKIVISVENLTKKYDLGVIGTGTIACDMECWWVRVRNLPKIREDAYKLRGEIY